MAANMELMMFASKISNPWWKKEGENYVFENATNREIYEKSRLSEFDVQIVPAEINGEIVDDYFLIVNKMFAGQKGYHKEGAIYGQCKGRKSLLSLENDVFPLLNEVGNILDCGATGSGEKAFFNLDLGSYEIGASHHLSRLSVAVPFDGMSKFVVGLNDGRIECENTYNRFLSSLNEGEHLATKQTKNVKERVNGWFEILAEMQKEKEALAENFKKLASMVFSKEKQAEIIKKVFNEKESKRTVNQMVRVAEILEDNASKIPPEDKGTGYDIFNAFTFYTSHESPINKGTQRVDSLLFGTAGKLANKAFDVIFNAVPDRIKQQDKDYVRAIGL